MRYTAIVILLRATPDTLTSVEVLVVLFVILAASSATFWLLNRRWTSHRQWVTLAEWARDAGFRLERREIGRVPAPLDVLPPAHSAVVRMCLSADGMILAQIQTDAPNSETVPATGPGQVVWNLVIKEMEAAWPPTGLRPSHTARSVLDLYSLSSFPLLGTTERFVVFGTDAVAAATLSRSMARSLLPPDIGLLLHGHTLALDFSERPFDPLELDRMIALAQQLAQKLPAPEPP